MKKKKNSEITFPEIKFWNKGSEQINVINPSDFWKDELMTKLNLKESLLSNSMASSERPEVISRQEIMRLLQENPELRKFVKDSVDINIPQEGQSFLDEFSPKRSASPFMEKVISLKNLLFNVNLKSSLSGKMADFFNFLEDTIERAKIAEREFGEVMGEEIEKASQLHGRTTFVLSGSGDVTEISIAKKKEEEGFGYRLFSFKLSEKYKIILDKGSSFWDDKKVFYNLMVLFSILFFPIGIYILIHNFRFKKMAFRPMVIDKVPYGVKNDIRAFLIKTLITKPNDKLKNELIKQQNKRVKKLPEILSFKGCGEGITYLEVYYQYSKDGLKIRILRVYSEVGEDNYLYSPPVYDANFFGYSASEIHEISKRSQRLAEDATSQVTNYSRTSRLLNFIEKEYPKLLNRDVLITSGQTDREYKYYTIGEVSNLPHVAPYYRRVMDYRHFIYQTLAQLGNMTDLLERVLNSSRIWHIPVEYPEILSDNEHVIGFETIYPIHLIGRKSPSGSVVEAKNLVPINSLPPLNGQIVGLTGQNGGGKTATLNELVYLLYLAQSGLPVFGTGVRLNVKKTIGLVFNTRGEGSQLQNFLFKTKNVFESIRKLPSNATVVFLDELGSGAQHEDGISLGKEILKTLRHSGVSTIYNTQLPEIAEYSEKELNAVCFQFTLNHQVRKGIGLGNANVLAKQVGIDKFFIENN